MPGVVGTEWEGGVYPITMAFPPSYPMLPPTVKMPPGFMHVNVFPLGGGVCRDVIRAGEGWEPSITVKEILRVCQHSLDNPNPLNPTQEAAYNLFTHDRAAYSEKAKAQAVHFSEARFLEEHVARFRNCAICSRRPGAGANTETGISLPNNQRQHRTSHAPKDVLPLRICANYCAPCQVPAHTCAEMRRTARRGAAQAIRL